MLSTDKGLVDRRDGPPRYAFTQDDRLNRLLDCAADGVGKFVVDDIHTVLYASQGLLDLLGLSWEAFAARGSARFIHPDHRAAVDREAEEAMREGRPMEASYRIQRPDGPLVWVRVRGAFIMDETHHGKSVINLFFTNMTELVTTNQQLAQETGRYRAVATISRELLFELDAQTGEVTHFYQDLDNFRDVARATPENVERFLRAVDGREGVIDTEIQMRNAEGDLIWHHLRTKVLEGTGGRRFLGVIENVQDSHDKMERLVRRADLDAATGLRNRFAIQRAVEKRITSGLPYLCAILDVDDFKQINDSHGHVFGDSVLRFVADILLKSCRPTDMAGRLGGDEFLVLYNAEFSEAQARERMQTIVDRVCKDQRILSQKAEVTVSVGAILVSQPGLYFLDLYRRADLALYTAKTRGKNAYVLDIFGG